MASVQARDMIVVAAQLGWDEQGVVKGETVEAQMRQAYRPTPDEVHGHKRGVMHDTVTAAPGLHQEGGPVGGGMYTGTPAATLGHLFGLDRGR